MSTDTANTAATATTGATKPKTTRRSRAKAPVTSVPSPGDSLPKISAAPATGNEKQEGNQTEVARLQKLLRASQERVAQLTKDEAPPEPIADAALKPLLAEHIRTGASIGRHALTPEQKAQWKACKASRKAAINGRIYRKRVLGNVTRAANEGAFSRYRERVAAKSKRLAGFTLGATFKAPKSAKK